MPTSTAKKPAALRHLKQLPEDQQAQIIAWLGSPEGADGAQRLLREKWGVQLSVRALWDFYFWWQLRRHLEMAARFADQVRRTLAALPGYDPRDELVSLAAQVAFEMKALHDHDWRAWCQFRRLRQKERDLRNDERKLALWERKAAQADAAAALAQTPLSPEEREQRLKEIFGLP
jgi:hypothetical protein